MAPRQETLRGALAWSYDWLEPDEKRLFRHLGVFVGGFDLGAGSWVMDGRGPDEPPAPSSPELLASLVDQSLVRCEARGADEPRFSMLETIRAYALERLVASGEDLAARRRHADYYLSLAEAAEPQLTVTHQTEWLDRLALEHDNLRAALAWCIEERDAERGLRLGAALWLFWYVRGHFTEGRQWLERLLKLPGATAYPSMQARALNGAGNLAFNQSDYVAARACHEQSLALRRGLGDRRGIAGSLNNLGLIARQQGDLPTARTLFQEAIATNRALGNRPWEALSLGNLGTVLRSQGHFEEARALHELSLALFQSLGDEWGSGMALLYLAEVARSQGDLDEAHRRYLEGLEKARLVGDQRRIAQVLAGLAYLACCNGNHADAYRHFEWAGAIWSRLGDVHGVAACLEGLASILVHWSRPEPAARLLGSAEALRESSGSQPPHEPDTRRHEAIADVRGDLGDELLATVWASGRAMSPDAALEYAASMSDGT